MQTVSFEHVLKYYYNTEDEKILPGSLESLDTFSGTTSSSSSLSSNAALPACKTKLSTYTFFLTILITVQNNLHIKNLNLPLSRLKR